MQSNDSIVPSLLIRRILPTFVARKGILQRLSYRAASHDDTAAYTFGLCRGFRAVGRGEEHIRNVIDHHSVVLFGHAPVTTAQSRLYVADNEPELASRQRPGEIRVRVATHQDDPWPFLHQDPLDPGEHFRSLLSLEHSRPPLPNTMLRWRKAEVIKEDPVHILRVMLAGVDNKVGEADLRQAPEHRRELDNARSCAHNDGHDLATANRDLTRTEVLAHHFVPRPASTTPTVRAMMCRSRSVVRFAT